MSVILSSKSKKRDKALSGDAELIKTSLKRFQVTAEAETESRKQGLEDLKFSIGTGQWDEAVKANREIDSPRVHKSDRVSANRFHHEVKLSSPGEVDRELQGWLKDAYELSA